MAKKSKAVAEEKLYTIPLRSEWIKHARIRRTGRSVNVIRSFLEKHLKTDDIKISKGVNEFLWVSGAKYPPAKIKISVSVEDGVALARLPEEVVQKAEKGKSADEVKEGAKGKAEKKPETRVKEAAKTEKPATKEGENKALSPEEEAAQLWKEAEKKAKKGK